MGIRSQRKVNGKRDPTCRIEIIAIFLLLLATLVLAFPLG